MLDRDSYIQVAVSVVPLRAASDGARMERKIPTEMANRSIYSHGLFGNPVIFNRDRISPNPHTFFPLGNPRENQIHKYNSILQEMGGDGRIL